MTTPALVPIFAADRWRLDRANRKTFEELPPVSKVPAGHSATSYANVKRIVGRVSPKTYDVDLVAINGVIRRVMLLLEANTFLSLERKGILSYDLSRYNEGLRLEVSGSVWNLISGSADLLKGTPRAQVTYHQSPDRPFAPSKQLVELVVQSQKPFPDDARQLIIGDREIDVSAEDTIHFVFRGIEGAISSWAHDNASTNRVLTKPIIADGRFDDSIAEWLIRRLNVGINQAQSVLTLVASELKQFLEVGPIRRSWGTLNVEGKTVLAKLNLAPARAVKNPRAKASLAV